MFGYISAKEAAEKWDISQRRVALLCAEKRIPRAVMFGNMWVIPENAEKPIDKRTTRYTKNTIPLKPFIKWAGGKSQLVSEVEKIALADNDNVLSKYAEPMVGGGALLFDILSRYNFNEFYISDINQELINTYIVVQRNIDELIERLKSMQTSYLSFNDGERKSFYYDIRKKFNNVILNENTSTEKAAYFIFLNKTCFNGLYRVNHKGQFNVPMEKYKNPKICDEENLRNIHKALKNVQIVCGDYTLSKSFIDKNTFVYIDPPYRPLSETAAFTSYNADIFDDKEQIRLAEFINEINSVGAKIVLSNSDPKNINTEDNFFDDLYKDYRIQRVSAKRMINSKANMRGKINELLIYN